MFRLIFFNSKWTAMEKKPLVTVITYFLKLHMNKGKAYTFKNFKKFGILKATIYSWMKKIEEKDRGTRNFSCHPKVHAANENGLNSLLKF